MITISYDLQAMSGEPLVELLNDLAKYSPDIILLQGVCKGNFVTVVRTLREKLYNHRPCKTDKHEVEKLIDQRPSVEMTFSLMPIKKVEFFHYQNSREFRGITIVRMLHNDEEIVIANTRFEVSPDSTTKKIRQIETLNKVFKDEKVILCCASGIRNFQTDIQEPEGWLDAWWERGNDSNNYNSIVMDEYQRHTRFWYKNVTCKKYETIGDYKSRDSQFEKYGNIRPVLTEWA